MPLDSVATADRVPEDDWSGADVAALIDHIIDRYHEVHMTQLPEAIAMARRVETVHADHPHCPRGLADHLATIADDLASHQHREETVLFPLMLAGGHSMIRHPIARMTDEHRDVDEQLLRLAALTGDFSPPDGACGTWRGLYRACQIFDRDLRDHMRLEEDVLFPRFL